jgi:hypothetical protein
MERKHMEGGIRNYDRWSEQAVADVDIGANNVE